MSSLKASGGVTSQVPELDKPGGPTQPSGLGRGLSPQGCLAGCLKG